MPSERPSYTEQVAQYFRDHPGEWIDGRKLAEIGGCYAWRSRVSDCNKPKCEGGKYEMGIVNRQRLERAPYLSAGGTQKHYKVSEYRYDPPRPASTSDQHDANTFTLRAEAGRLGV